MLRLDALRRLPWVARLAGIGLAVAVAVTAVLAVIPSSGEIRYEGVPRLELPLPAPDAAPSGSGDASAPAAPALRAEGGLAPVDPALIEDGTFGPLPRIAPGGRTPLATYARPFDLDRGRPKVAVIVLGLGLQEEITEAALALPDAVTLQFSPYAPDLQTRIEDARRDGHEVLLRLPMEPLDFPDSDPGPHTLLADDTASANRERLSWVLSRATGYVGLAGSGRGFTQSTQAVPAMQELAERGVAMIEVGSDDLAEVASELGVSYASTEPPIDEEPSTLAIDFALARLESQALATGSALGVAQLYPVSLERIAAWAAELGDRGLVLAPASALVRERSGLGADLGDADPGAAAAAGRG